MVRLRDPEDVDTWFLQHGWFPDRDIGTQAGDLVGNAISEYLEEGVVLQPLAPATRFLREHGALRLSLSPGRGDSVVFEPAKMWHGEPAEVAELAESLGVRLFPIGYDTSEGSCILMDEQGRFFYIHETGNHYMGAGKHEAFISLANAPMRDAEDHLPSAIPGVAASPLARGSRDEVEAWLTEVGWYPGRDIGDQVPELLRVVTDKYAAEGFPIDPIQAAVEFLREYGLLQLTIPGEPTAILVFTPHWIYEESGEDVAEFAARLGVKVFPVGYETFDGSMLLIDERERFFLLHHTGSYFAGTTRYEAVRCLLRGPLEDAEGHLA
ncbi:SUKH-3 domain-containing protein [Streptomyces sp. NBC_00536]|uniref:SUKH-3 domain-containing protein n=1 Tax=Streptomyces sp. NBC_00536 TaxID=2975769 RepID=UPI002E802AEC|nr:SUKH-3 domain-containing protein [Streptomyces sp. NBC_00536]WUC80520.1 SUKH-3 domain-containing protein [Streptomyces sp. NBC_00536]